MRTLNLRRTLARLTAIAAAASASGATAATLNVCVESNGGDMRVVRSSRSCHRDETFLTLAACTQTNCNDFRGPDGAQGPAGDIGPVGPVGSKGDVGPAGAQGVAGIAGPMGPVGPMGLTGPKGDTGAQGAAGVAGPVGPKGDTGATGSQGVAGVAGPVGPKGDTGATGTQGIAGIAGPVGPMGPQGPQGILGPMGAQGPQGPAGVSGSGTGGGSVVAFSESVFKAKFINAGAPMATTVATLDLTPGSWVIVGKAMASAISDTTSSSEANCALVSGIGGGANLDYHSVAMSFAVHNTITMAAPIKVTDFSNGHIELQCQSYDTTDGMIENAQMWAVQVSELTSAVQFPSF